ncbi:MAG: glycosyltransferase [Deltaproteobacteria bacterium]|jgi:glycosyltransferase involved in cell wall biosynthesis|nr:glycosyltransferase [Deltaproteobacteria bacterium]
MTGSLITAIIPTWNRAWSIERAVGSVLAQKGADFELIVVDDGSDDGTAGILAGPAAGGQLRYLRNPGRRGVSAARNVGIRAARGDLVAFLDSDDEWLPGKLKAQAEYMAQNPDLLISQCQERWIRAGRRVNPGLRHRKPGGDIFFQSLALCLVSPSATIARKALFDEVGLFDEELASAEDYDLWLRVSLTRPVGLLDRELVVRHGGRPDQLSSAPGLDRFRVMALKKLLAMPLPADKEAAVRAELARREAILEKGRQKRLREGLGADF